MRLLVTGITGIHGWPLYRHLLSILPQGQVFGIRSPGTLRPDYPDTAALCISDRAGLSAIREQFRPTHVLHCAGVCDLNVCEERPGWAHNINTAGTQNIVDLFGDDCFILFTSTDLVFSGYTPPAGGYAEHHAPDPISVVGKTFAAAEDCVRACPRQCTVRLGLPLGASLNNDKGAEDWIAGRLSKQRPVTLFHDEYRSGIAVEDIVDCIVEILRNEWQGLFHLGGNSAMSLYSIGEMVLKRGGYAPELMRGILRADELKGPPRVGNVALDSAKIRNLRARAAELQAG